MLLTKHHRAEVRSSFITTTVRDQSQVTPQGLHRYNIQLCTPVRKCSAVYSH